MDVDLLYGGNISRGVGTCTVPVLRALPPLSQHICYCPVSFPALLAVGFECTLLRLILFVLLNVGHEAFPPKQRLSYLSYFCLTLENNFDYKSFNYSIARQTTIAGGLKLHGRITERRLHDLPHAH